MISFELPLLFAAGLAYLLLLFGIALACERGWIRERLLRHPFTYILSLGVFVSAWGVYGGVELAYHYGWGYLSYYAGIAGAFIFAPLLLLPLLRLCKQFQLGSLADIITFRFRSQFAGALFTLAMLLALLPLLSLQIQAVSDSLYYLAGGSTSDAQGNYHDTLALLYCALIIVFCVLFGSRHVSAQQHHNGLIGAIAFESLVKLIGLLVLGACAVYGVFGGFQELDNWLNATPSAVNLLTTPLREDSARALLLLFFSAAVTMPHLFHMVFVECPSPRALHYASWGLPLLALIMSLPTLPVLWAGIATQSPLPLEYYALGLGSTLDSSALSLLIFITGLSAASGVIIVSTLSLASMCLNHLVLPLYTPDLQGDVYRSLLWMRRWLIALILAACFGFYLLIEERQSLSTLGLTAFIATLQFLPGVLAVLYWPRASRIGLICGLLAGLSLWLVMLLLPIFSLDGLANGITALLPDAAQAGYSWSLAALTSLAVNTLVFIGVSLAMPVSEDEMSAAELCSLDDLSRPMRHSLAVEHPGDVVERLARVLGNTVAQREVDRALGHLHYDYSERRPFALRRLRIRLEINLSGLVGPSVAHEVINQVMPYRQEPGQASTEDINLIEARLEKLRSGLTGMAADLDALRLHYRSILQELPIGLCSLTQDGEIVLWNRVMAELTGISSQEVVGSHISALPTHWHDLLETFWKSSEQLRHKARLEQEGQPRWVALHKAVQRNQPVNEQVIIVEDLTETQLLEEELIHAERLASIGRLAAGVAHEIGNPITGIASLAQNLKYDTDEPAILESAQDILLQAKRVGKIVQTLVNFAHAGQSRHEHRQDPVPVAECVAEAIHLLQLNKDAQPIRFDNRCDATWVIRGDAQKLLQVFVNLLSNARDASPADSQVWIQGELRDEHWLQIDIIDQGSGIEPEHLEQVFDPFFTTKEAGQGTGLGLSLVYSIIEELRGQIDIHSPAHADGRGTRVTLTLPCYRNGG